MTHTFVIDGEPIPWARPGQGRWGRYDTQKGVKFAIGCIINQQWGNHKPLTGFVLLTSIFYVPIPESYSNKKREVLHHTPSLKKPDTDNLDKLYRDILTDVGIWKDDAQVCCSIGAKIYSKQPQVILKVREIDMKEFYEFVKLL